MNGARAGEGKEGLRNFLYGSPVVAGETEGVVARDEDVQIPEKILGDEP